MDKTNKKIKGMILIWISILKKLHHHINQLSQNKINNLPYPNQQVKHKISSLVMN